MEPAVKIAPMPDASDAPGGQLSARSQTVSLRRGKRAKPMTIRQKVRARLKMCNRCVACLAVASAAPARALPVTISDMTFCAAHRASRASDL